MDARFAAHHLLYLQLNRLEKSTAIPGLSRDDAYALRVTIPPTREQRRIVAKIEELFSELDKGVEALTTAREQLKAYRQSVLKHAFEGKMTANLRPTHKVLRNVRLGDELEFLTSGSRGWADYYAKSGDTFIRSQNLKYDRLDLTDIAYVKLPKGNTEGIRTRVQVGDVLVTITGANVTKTGIVDSNLGAAYVSQHVALCRPRPSIKSRFLYWYLLSEAHGRRQLNEAAYGAGKPGLNLDNIKSVAISLPSAQEQAIVVERIEAALSVEQSFSESIDSELQRTNALRQSILKRAFSGQLVAQDAADEPASLLLERIRVERKKTDAKKPGRKTKITGNSKTGKRAIA
jgi:type I restriction enzyme S subunit